MLKNPQTLSDLLRFITKHSPEDIAELSSVLRDDDKRRELLAELNALEELCAAQHRPKRPKCHEAKRRDGVVPEAHKTDELAAWSKIINSKSRNLAKEPIVEVAVANQR